MIQRVGLVQKQLLYDLADIVRLASGSTGTIQVGQLPARISQLLISGQLNWSRNIRADGDTLGAIQESLLIEIGDAIRLVTGTHDKIEVAVLPELLSSGGAVKQRLDAPSITLVDVEVDEGTSAVLGIAVLGKMILGNSGGGVTPSALSAPTITLVELGSALSAPNIELVEV